MSQFFINASFQSTQRFDMGRFMEFTDNYDPLTSSFLETIPTLLPSGTYVVQGEDGRPELLSKAIYGDFQYWWILLIYNGQIDYRGLTTGMTIAFPALSDLEDAYFSLKSLQQAAAKRA
jgi:hypothetical protein